MILPGSYANGFAPRDGQPLYPSLWKGCVGAWAPCLGPTGLTLRDWSGYGNHGALTNGPTWSPSDGKTSIEFDGSNDYVVATVANYRSQDSIGAVSVWVRPNNATGSTIISSADTAVNGSYIRPILWSSNNKIFCQSSIEGDASSDLIETNASFSHSVWHHCVCRSNGTAWDIWVDGVQQAVTVIAGTNSGRWFGSISARDNIVLGTLLRLTPAGYHSGMIDDARIYSRAISANEIRLLASRRGIAYEIAPRRRTSSAVQFNRRRRLLVGAGS